MKTTEPKKMKANPAANGSTFSSMHDGEHDERFSCKDTGCLPADPAPVTEPRPYRDCSCCENGDLLICDGHACTECGRYKPTVATSPPAPVPPEAFWKDVSVKPEVTVESHLANGIEEGRCEQAERTPVKRWLTEEERNVVSWSKAQVQTIIFRLCAELDSKDGEIQLFSGATEEQRRRADTLERLREYWIASNEASRERLRMAVIEGRRLSEVLDERDQLKRDLAAAHKLIQSSSKPCGWPNCEPAKQALADLAAAQLRENGLWEVFLPCIQDYLLKGGHFNPECMEHEKVRELLKDIRAALTKEDK